jgi:hypothetical protein
LSERVVCWGGGSVSKYVTINPVEGGWTVNDSFGCDEMPRKINMGRDNSCFVLFWFLVMLLCFTMKLSSQGSSDVGLRLLPKTLRTHVSFSGVFDDCSSKLSLSGSSRTCTPTLSASSPTKTPEEIIQWGVLIGNSKDSSPQISPGDRYLAFLAWSWNKVSKVKHVYSQVVLTACHHHSPTAVIC